MHWMTRYKDELIKKMTEYFAGDGARIDHAIAVTHYAGQLLAHARYASVNPEVVMASAILHDIGIVEAERKHHSTAAYYQELEGPPIARSIMESLNMPKAYIREVCDIVGHHHSPGTIHTSNFQILYDADCLVNFPERYSVCDQDVLQQQIDEIFLTEQGKKLAREVFLGMYTNPHNPLFPLQTFIPDPEAHVMPDGRVYVYGSQDKQRGTYCSNTYRVFSSSDLTVWTDHGESFNTEAIPWTDTPLYAPDAVFHQNSYYLYFCHADGSEGVATCPSPQGPFTAPTRIEGISGIDPAIFIDDDGRAYYYWGQIKAKGARLQPNMREIERDSIVENLVTEETHFFHEGSSVRKRNGVYYFIYADISRGRPTCLGYATSHSPLGPFTYQGIIIDNAGCDPEVWNNHGSIEEINGEWYVFYHRATRGSRYMRRACLERITFRPDGTIPEVEMTSQGAGPPLDAPSWLRAHHVCRLTGSVRIEDGPSGEEQLCLISCGDTAAFKFVDFGTGTSSVTLVVQGGGVIEVHVGTLTDNPIGRCEFEDTGNWQILSCKTSRIQGVHALYLRFRPTGELRFSKLCFA